METQRPTSAIIAAVDDKEQSSSRVNFKTRRRTKREEETGLPFPLNTSTGREACVRGRRIAIHPVYIGVVRTESRVPGPQRRGDALFRYR